MEVQAREEELFKLSPFNPENLRNDNCIQYTGKLAQYMVKKRPVLSGLWILGFILLFFAGGIAIDYNEQIRINNEFKQLYKEFEPLTDLKRELNKEYQLYQSAKGWFFSCDDRCQLHKKKYENLASQVRDYETRFQLKEKYLKNQIGVFSQQSVKEAKETFWQINKEGNESAKQMSFFDILFRGIGMAFDRDRELAETIFYLIFEILYNFLLTSIISFVRFIWNLFFYLPWYYTTNYISGFTFIFLGLTAAVSWFTLFNYGLFLFGRGVVNTGLNSRDQQRIQNDRQEQIRRNHYIQQNQRFQQQQQQQSNYQQQQGDDGVHQRNIQ